jgi:ParB-like chromosome segregation protein Spo0J
MSKEDQPISAVQWVDRNTLKANDYNPNKMAKTELGLLKTSIMEDGWTQPIVARLDGEIVDGFHRWTVSADPDVAKLGDGLVPVVFIKEIDPARQRMATIRHNRARGEHYVMSMADIVSELVNEHGLDMKEIQRRLGMEKEEVMRLLDRGEMVKRAGNDDYKQAWIAEKR